MTLPLTFLAARPAHPGGAKSLFALSSIPREGFRTAAPAGKHPAPQGDVPWGAGIRRMSSGALVRDGLPPLVEVPARVALGRVALRARHFRDLLVFGMECGHPVTLLALHVLEILKV